MRRNTFHHIFGHTFPSAFLASFGLLLLLGNVSGPQAQVKQVEMHIAGYLCGN
jgi:hypothetical protein